ncbi:MAG: hypothetical protein RLZZ303_645 [Candidatus Hydrogenedentota bacterium]
MQLAVIGDIAGAAQALRAALDWIESEGILTILQTGNLAGPEGGDVVVALLQGAGVQVAQGETDRLHLRYEQKSEQLRRKMEPADFDALGRAHHHLSSASLEYLRDLHKKLRLKVEEVSILVCHGSLSSQGEILDQHTPPSRFQRLREEAGAQLVLCGGSEEAFHVRVEDTLFVGPGCLAPQPDHARFTVIDTDASPWTVTVKTVTF